MTAQVIDGRAVAQAVRTELRERTHRLRARGIVPGLAVLIVGDDPASAVYVRQKTRACEEVGVHAEVHAFPADVAQAALVQRIRELNDDPRIHGMIVQLPLPAHLEIRPILESIAVAKDVDGFHLYNVGALVIGHGDSVFPPCTPYGVMRLLEHAGIPIEGQNAVVVGASNIVGKPMGLMLLQRGATVSICHIKTRDLAQFTVLADILVVAAGCPNLIRPDMVKPGAVVIDVGINRLPDGRVVGDVDFAGVKDKAGFITPVPGGVGPMTVAMLIRNTVRAAERVAGSIEPDEVEEALSGEP